MFHEERPVSPMTCASQEFHGPPQVMKETTRRSIHRREGRVQRRSSMGGPIVKPRSNNDELKTHSDHASPDKNNNSDDNECSLYDILHNPPPTTSPRSQPTRRQSLRHFTSEMPVKEKDELIHENEALANELQAARKREKALRRSLAAAEGKESKKSEQACRRKSLSRVMSTPKPTYSTAERRPSLSPTRPKQQEQQPLVRKQSKQKPGIAPNIRRTSLSPVRPPQEGNTQRRRQGRRHSISTPTASLSPVPMRTAEPTQQVDRRRQERRRSMSNDSLTITIENNNNETPSSVSPREDEQPRVRQQRRSSLAGDGRYSLKDMEKAKYDDTYNIKKIEGFAVDPKSRVSSTMASPMEARRDRKAAKQAANAKKSGGSSNLRSLHL